MTWKRAFFSVILGLFLSFTLEAGRVHCLMKTQSDSKNVSKKKVVNVGGKTVVRKTVTKSMGMSGQTLMIYPGKRGKLRYNGLELGVTCNPTDQTIILTFDLQHDDLSVQTVLRVDEGESVEVASVVEDLEDEAQSVGFPEGFFQKKKSGQKQKNLNLSVQLRQI